MDNKKIGDSESFDFIDNLKKNSLKTPNEFTIKMGKLVRDARVEHSWSQSDLSEKINRRPATISYIENGKSDISVQTLLVLAIVLGKPISYFFPQSLLKDRVMDVKSEFQHKALDYLRIIDFVGAREITLKILKVIADDCEEELDNRNNDPENYDE